MNDMDAQTVLRLMGRGRDNVTPLSEIAETLNWTRRRVELAVRDLRLQGRPIHANGRGVWYSDDEKDLDRTIASLHHRLVSQYLTLRELRATRARMAKHQQQSLWA